MGFRNGFRKATGRCLQPGGGLLLPTSASVSSDPLPVRLLSPPPLRRVPLTLPARRPARSAGPSRSRELIAQAQSGGYKIARECFNSARACSMLANARKISQPAATPGEKIARPSFQSFPPRTCAAGAKISPGNAQACRRFFAQLPPWKTQNRFRFPARVAALFLFAFAHKKIASGQRPPARPLAGFLNFRFQNPQRVF